MGIINQKENGENRLILGFNNGFYLALEKRDNQIKQELLQWHGKPSITIKFPWSEIVIIISKLIFSNSVKSKT